MIWFNEIAILATPQLAIDKGAFGLSRVIITPSVTCPNK